MQGDEPLGLVDNAGEVRINPHAVPTFQHRSASLRRQPAKNDSSAR
jgi:hypothetical protein